MQFAFAGYFRPMGRLGTRAGSFPDPVAARGVELLACGVPGVPGNDFVPRGQGRSGPWGRASPCARSAIGSRGRRLRAATDHASGRCTPSVARLPVDRAVEASRGTRYGVHTSPASPLFSRWRYHVRGGAGLTSVRTGDMSDRLARDPEADRRIRTTSYKFPATAGAELPTPSTISLTTGQ